MSVQKPLSIDADLNENLNKRPNKNGLRVQSL